ncbi:hypothetical protein SAMN04487981_102423 [Streptomyces sp. cf386]|uniref:hypothetical protein n=1 Tax=Streptomyces sp. cf386 TaxID=1761904 RepID=UPI00089123B7|nr:hypothetical protein [Streptomyces sp. cf386]SDM73769.1 hypothetical protein SAMN04487981_102423 [Streptomyces sp. cf386]
MPTERIAVREEYIRRAVPAYTGCDVGEVEWSTAHGDFHWSNLGGPDLTILDWEGWGRAPVGFDAAQLYVYSLHTPLQAADRTPFYKELAGPVKEYLASGTGGRSERH